MLYGILSTHKPVPKKDIIFVLMTITEFMIKGSQITNEGEEGEGGREKRTDCPWREEWSRWSLESSLSPCSWT